MEKVVILGTGSGGLTAAIYAARANLDPLVIEGLEPGGQLTTTTEVENFPGFSEGVTGPELMQEMREQAERFETRFKSGTVVSSDLSGKPLKIVLDGDDVIEAESLIIATGASAKYLGLESEQKLLGRGVSACATCDGAFYRDVPVVVVGGGDTAIEEAIFLTRFASKVYVVHRRDELRASKIMGDRAKKNPKIEFVWDSVIVDVMDPEKGEVTGVKIRNVKTGDISELEVTGYFSAIGHKPNTDAFEGQLEMDDVGYLKTRNTRTSVEGVFAAGDCQDSQYRQAITAAGSGCMAALEAQRYLESLEG